MGRGNVCVTGDYEGLYYIDNDHIHVYRDSEDMSDYPETRLMGDLDYGELTSGRWLYDEEGTGNELDDIEECFMEDFTKMFPSFRRSAPNCWMRNGPYGSWDRRAILESNLFYITIEDNEWSMAVELIQKEDPYDNHLNGLQKRHYQSYLDGIKKCLLNRLPSIGCYAGAWTSGVIKREDIAV